jgi:hypothetical protein
MRGAGVLDWLKKAGRWVTGTALPFVKKHQLLSKGLKLIPHPYAQKGSAIASTLGYGRRRSMRRGGALRLAGGALYM